MHHSHKSSSRRYRNHDGLTPWRQSTIDYSNNLSTWSHGKIWTGKMKSKTTKVMLGGGGAVSCCQKSSPLSPQINCDLHSTKVFKSERMHWSGAKWSGDGKNGGKSERKVPLCRSPPRLPSCCRLPPRLVALWILPCNLHICRNMHWTMWNEAPVSRDALASIFLALSVFLIRFCFVDVCKNIYEKFGDQKFGGANVLTNSMSQRC